MRLACALVGGKDRNRLSGMSRILICGFLLALLVWAQRSVPVENEFVRVVSVVDQQAAKPGAVHEHKENRVMLYLDAGDINIRYTDGRAEDQHWKAGDIAWSQKGGMHTSQHVSVTPTRIVEIELRKATGKSVGAAQGKVVLENAEVRVYRSSAVPVAGDYLAVDMKTAETSWNRLPAGAGPFVITLLK